MLRIMNICWIEPEPLINKIRSWGRYQKLLYLSKNQQVELISRNWPSMAEEIRKVTDRQAILNYMHNSVIFLLWAFLQIFKMRNRINLIYTFSDYSFLIGYLIKGLLNIKWVIDVEEIPELQLEWLRYEQRNTPLKELLYRLKLWGMSKAIRRADLVVCLGTSIDIGYPSRLISHYGVPANAIHPMPLGVDSKTVVPEKYPQSSQTGFFNILYAGALRRGRGLENLLLAVAALSVSIPSLKVTLVGKYSDDVEKQALQSLIDLLELESSVDYQGYVTHGETMAFVAAADVCVCPFPKLPALEYAYTLKIPEYLAMGKAVVATDLLCNRDIIANGDNGILTKDNDPRELCRALYRLYSDPDLRHRLEANARDSVKELNWEDLLINLENRLKHLISNE